MRILTGKQDLIIQENLTEYRIAKIDSRDAVLDVLATDDKGVVYHIEIQLADSDDHILRVRFYSAMTDSELLEKGTKYTDLPSTHIFYICMNDFMNLKAPIAKVRSYIGDDNKVYDDGKSIFFVNAAVNDQSEVAKLMDYFKLAEPHSKVLEDGIFELRAKQGSDISRIENGTRNPSLEMVKRLARGMGMVLKLEFVPDAKAYK